jgi:hypothetical protein
MMPESNRRSFLGLLGIGAVSAPLAVKAAADTSIASMAGVTSLGLGNSGVGLAIGGGQAVGGCGNGSNG